MSQQIRFCTSGEGVRLAYSISGSGPPLVRAPHFFSHLEHDWEPPMKSWVAALSERYSYLRFDQRGCGLSDRAAGEVSLEAWVRDLECVVDAAGLQRFAIAGLSQGASIAVTYAVRHPERVSHLLIYGGYARGSAKRGASAEELAKSETIVRLAEVGWGSADSSFRQVFSTQFMPDGDPESIRLLNELIPLTSSAELAAAAFRAFGQIDVQAEAKLVRCPTLVMHARHDTRIPFEEGRLLAGLIPSARFVVLESRNHLLTESEPAWQQFLAALDEFYPGLGAGPGGAFADLTTREREVLEFIAQGLDNTQIAAHLTLSGKTVRNHITHIFDKIGVENRSQAIVLARERGLGQRS